MPELELDEIQGLILRGYNMPLVRHFVLEVGDPAAAKRFLGACVNGDGSAVPQITTAAPWATKPDYCLNVGITYAGLERLGLPAASLAGFDPKGLNKAFIAGAVAAAERVGDFGDSVPAQWIGGLGDPSRVHLLVSLFARDPDGDSAVLELVSARLRTNFASGDALRELSAHTGAQLPGGGVHFGFQDGMSQPTLDGAPPGRHPSLPVVPAGSFLLGHDSQWDNFRYPVPPPDEFGRNGSFAAFRILRQDVHAFESFLDRGAAELGISRELLAAKVCGRWRNGVPLTLSPDTDSPNPPVTDEQMSAFDYRPSAHYPHAADDRRGLVCPVGSHARRAYPRSDDIAGGPDAGHRRRIVRRGVPYGPPYDPAVGEDGIDRGLLGLFICVDLDDQFEFLMARWINEGGFNGHLPHASKDPMLGSNSADTSDFAIPSAGQPSRRVGTFPRFVTTRGAAYCFLPSVSGIRFIAAL